MAFITRCWKNGGGDVAARCICLFVLVCCATLVHAQSPVDIGQLSVERVDDEVIATGNIVFELPAVVEDALLKGVPLYFVLEAELLRERWYWFDRKMTSAKRHMRLVYLPLMRRWRLNVTAGAGREGGVGLALNQNYDTLDQALAAVKRVPHWQIADAAEILPGTKYKVELRFRLDLSQLPLPFQIGAFGQSEWDLAATATVPLNMNPAK
ncbi:MAG: DUF4390 domain-containing protein [Burkholderiales bacterium]|jgi:hypothetical protein|nr:DUF4390 domain-containing protein [Burkholderiales bacterium]MBK9347419.1 DUF4390 domain-containing protein [Burkholderiales bacterium]